MLRNTLASIATFQNAAELIQLGTILGLSEAASSQSETDKGSTDFLTYERISNLMSLTYVASKYFDSWGVENEAKARDDFRYPADKADASKNLLLSQANNINKTGNTATMLGIMGLVAGSPGLQKACTVLAPLAAAGQSVVTHLTTDALKTTDRVNASAVAVKDPNEAEQPGLLVVAAAADRKVDSTQKQPQQPSILNKVLTLRNGATFLFVGSTVVMSYLSMDKNDMSSSKVVTYSFLAKMMNLGLSISNGLRVVGTVHDAHVYDDRLNPRDKSDVSEKQKAAKWITLSGMGLKVVGLIGLFAGTEDIRKAASIVTPLVSGGTTVASRVYADEVIRNANVNVIKRGASPI